jgi:serpin B
MWRKVPAWLAGLALVLSLGAAAAPPDLPPLLRAGDARQPPLPGTPTARLAESITGLGHRMSATTPDGNWVASPLSVTYAYGMVRAGARGHTAVALDELYGLPGDRLHPTLNAIGAAVESGDVSIANGLFLQQGFTVGAPFLRTLATQYGTGVHPVDFSTPEVSDVVNGWVSEQTHGRIPRIFQWQPGVVAVLANAIYLDADWARPFGGVHPTTPAAFTTAAGPVTVPMMQQIAEIPYAEGDGWQAADLAYRDSDLVMRILLPAPGRDPVELLPRTGEIGAAMRAVPVDLRLPKWESRSTVDLSEVGPPELYQGADLSGIAQGVWISRAVHEAWIRVDEEGTEAAAATSISIAVSAQVPPDIRLHADRPFAYAIVHKPTGVPLFMGRVADPGR